MARARAAQQTSASGTSGASEDVYESYDEYLEQHVKDGVRESRDRELTAFLTRVNAADATPAGYLSSGQRRVWKRLEAEAVTLAFYRHLADADAALDRSASYVTARANERAKTWYVLVIGCALAIPFVVGLFCALLCGSLPTWFVQSRQTYVAQVFLNAVMAGAVGAGFSQLTRLGRIEFRLDSKLALVLQALARLALGCIAACIVVTAIKADFIFTAVRLTPGSQAEFWFLFVLGIAAGLLERFVPSPSGPPGQGATPPSPPGGGHIDIAILLAEIRKIKSEWLHDHRELQLWIELKLKQFCGAPDRREDLSIAAVGRVPLAPQQGNDASDETWPLPGLNAALAELTRLAGLDEITARDLFQRGIRNLNAIANLSESDIEELASVVKTCSEANLRDWRQQARKA